MTMIQGEEAKRVINEAKDIAAPLIAPIDEAIVHYMQEIIAGLQEKGFTETQANAGAGVMLNLALQFTLTKLIDSQDILKFLVELTHSTMRDIEKNPELRAERRHKQ